MKTLYFAYPGDLQTPTGGYGYDRKIIAGLKNLGWHVALLPLGDGFPFPSKATLTEVREELGNLPDGSSLVVDGLAFGVMGEVAGRSAERLDLVALVHHPLCRETGLSPEQSDALFESELKALKLARHVIVTSHATGDQVRDLFGVVEQKISVVLPGTELPDPVARTASATTRLLCVGTVVPRKGYDLLFSALADLKELAWHLDIVGGIDADADCYQALLTQISALGLTERVTFHGAVAPENLQDYYREADVFVLASRYEGYGMAYTEALAYGLPVIGSGAGAVKDTLPQGAAIYCGTEDTGRLRNALEDLISDEAKRLAMAKAARRAVSSLPGWQDAAARFAAALQGQVA